MSDAQEQFGPLQPGAVIGILGGGQLGRMLSSAAARLGLKCHIYCPDEKCPAAEVSDQWTRAAYEDDAAIRKFVSSVDVVTYEFENVPVECARMIEEAGGILRPGITALEVAQDRLAEKRFLKSLEIETAPFMPVASEEALGMAMNVTGLPAILKTRRLGYDGKGQSVIHDEDEAAGALQAIDKVPAILEGFVPFEREISVLIVRDQNGIMTAYDPAENDHRDGILRTSTVPSACTAEVIGEAQEIAAKIATALDYIGVLAVEFFVEKSGRLRVNEIAPRVHNSGHWTLEACTASQFENHIRAVAGWPLGSVHRHTDCRMENIIGHEMEKWQEIASDPHACVTLYGKKEMRPGRKMGHITWLKN